MAKMKKGVLFTLGILMLVTIVFSLAILLFRNTQSMENRFSELVLLDQLSGFDGMLQNNVRDINAYESGLAITVSKDSVSFTEAFPRSERFAEVMEEYKDYIETNYSAAPKITFDDNKFSEIKTNQLMYIMPYRILYEHDNGFRGSGYSGDNYILDPGTNYDKILEYNISFKVDAVSATLSQETIHSGDLLLHVKITSQGGSLLYSQEWKIDPEFVNILSMDMFEAGGLDAGDINIKVGHQASLDINYPESITRTSVLEIALTEPGAQEGPVEVKYDEDLFTINFEEAKLMKKGTVKLA